MVSGRLLAAVPAGRAASRPLLLPWTCRRCFAQGSSRWKEQEQPPVNVSADALTDAEPAPAPKELVPRGSVIFSGIQPTGVPHLGNYLGALQRWVELQDSVASDTGPGATQLYYSVVDLHALTSVKVLGGADELRKRRRQALAILLAIGLDPKRCVLFYQSAVSAHSELMWLLSCTASVGYLSRMTQWKTKIQASDSSTVFDDRARSNLKLGLFSYPVLQAADVLIHRATHVPVGEDQAQHLEFARECVTNFNHAHGRVLVQPSTLLSPARRVMSLQNPEQKMSKSRADPRSRILLTDSDETIQKKINGALTDSNKMLTYDPIGRPGVANLFELFVLTRERKPSDAPLDVSAEATALSVEVATASMRGFKIRVGNSIKKRLSGIRERYDDYITRENGAYLDRVAEQGAVRARKNAEETMKIVRAAVGLN